MLHELRAENWEWAWRYLLLRIFLLSYAKSEIPNQNKTPEEKEQEQIRIEVQDSWSFSSEKAKTFVIVHFRKSDYIEIKIQEPATKTEFECFVIYCFHRLSVQWRGSD